jgi:hypothetical protein
MTKRLPKFLRRRAAREPSVPPVESPAHYDAIGNWVPPGGYDGHHHAHNPETCPACDIERDTGEVAPPAAHLWMRPTDLTEEEWARFKRALSDARGRDLFPDDPPTS